MRQRLWQRRWEFECGYQQCCLPSGVGLAILREWIRIGGPNVLHTGVTKGGGKSRTPAPALCVRSALGQAASLVGSRTFANLQKTWAGKAGTKLPARGRKVTGTNFGMILHDIKREMSRPWLRPLCRLAPRAPVPALFFLGRCEHLTLPCLFVYLCITCVHICV